MISLFCLAPLALAGYVGIVQTPTHHSEDIGGAYTEFQSCKEGFGARLAFGAEWVQAGPQFGYTIPFGDDWALTIQGHGGLGYSNSHHPITGVRQVTKFDGGVTIILSVDRYLLKVGYDHMSNGRGYDPTNSGQEMISGAVGVVVDWFRRQP